MAHKAVGVTFEVPRFGWVALGYQVAELPRITPDRRLAMSARRLVRLRVPRGLAGSIERDRVRS
jgi:hypothetical protein